MHGLFKKENVLTIPNLLSLFRLLLIPVIVWLYCVRQDYRWTIVALAVSGLSDILDGIIARKFNMVSDLGKILDPCADKLTPGGGALLPGGAVSPDLGDDSALRACKELIMGAHGLYGHQVYGCGQQRKMVREGQHRHPLHRLRHSDFAARHPVLGGAAADLPGAGCPMIISLILYIRFYLLLFKQEKGRKSQV